MPANAGVAHLLLGSEALADGAVTRRELARRYRMVYRNVYCRKGDELSAADRATAAWLWSGRRAVVAGGSAAALHGSRWIPGDGPAELTRVQYRRPPGIVVHADSLRDDEIDVVGDVPCTTPPRTAYDLGRRLPLTMGLIRVDALLRATGIPVDDVAAVARRYPGARNIRRLRRVVELADAGAESPQESRLRLVLVGAGLPRPVTQIPFYDGFGNVIRRVDMGWPQFKVGVEYDGVQHWTDADQHAEDIDRLEFLAGLGWCIVRVSARHLRDDRYGIVCRATAALRAAGWSPETAVDGGVTRDLCS